MRAFLLIVCLFALAMPATAQEGGNLPALPPALKDLVDKGAQIRYLGQKHGLEGWITIYQGQEQYYYVTPDGKGFVMGVLFDETGRMATIDQVRDLQKQGGEILDLLTAERPDEAGGGETLSSVTDAPAAQSPAERMFSDVEASNWVRLGKESAPVLYSFVDPQCPHCHAFLNDLRKDYIEKGLVQVRLIPIGFRDETEVQAAVLLAAPDAQARWFRHLDGDESALPVKDGVSTQGVQRNLALMQAWKFNVTPLSIYRARNGEIKIIRGRAEDAAKHLADLPSSG